MNDPQTRKRDWNLIGMPVLIGLAVLVVILVIYGLTRPARTDDQIAASAAFERQMDASQARSAANADARAQANQDAMR